MTPEGTGMHAAPVVMLCGRVEGCAGLSPGAQNPVLQCLRPGASSTRKPELKPLILPPGLAAPVCSRSLTRNHTSRAVLGARGCLWNALKVL